MASARRLGWVLGRLNGSRALIEELIAGDRVELERLRQGLDAIHGFAAIDTAI